MTLTKKELKLLNEVNKYWDIDEPGFSEFTNRNVKTKSRAGVLSSLAKKGLVYDSYEDYDDDNTSMWCMTDDGVNELK